VRWAPLSETGLRSIRESTARLNIWEGAVRSSKTVCSLIRWVEYVATAPPGPLLMAGKTERTLKRNLLGPLLEMVGPKRFRLVSGAGELHLLGRMIYLAGANDERAEQKIRGLTLAGAYGDELSLWPESFFRMLLSRLSIEGAAFFGTTNPDSPYHWLKREFLDRSAELDLRSWHFRLSDNLSLSPAYIQALQAEYTGLWRKRYVEGLWVAAEGAVFDMFDEEAHVTAECPAAGRWFCGIDYGTTNPFHAVLVCAGDGRMHVAHEWRYDSTTRGRSKTDAEYARDIKGWLDRLGIQPEFVFIDPSAASFIEAARREQISGVWAADNAVLDGIRRMARLFSARRLTISPDCQELLREVAGYAWDPRAQERGEDRPLKQADHGCDALRYVINGTINVWGRYLNAEA